TRGWAAPEAIETYLRARELCERVGDTAQLFMVWGLGCFGGLEERSPQHEGWSMSSSHWRKEMGGRPFSCGRPTPDGPPSPTSVNSRPPSIMPSGGRRSTRQGNTVHSRSILVGTIPACAPKPMLRNLCG